MPLYEYQCEACGQFEQWRTMAEVSNPMLCPTCEAPAKRIYSPPGIMLNSSLRLKKSQSLEPKLVDKSRDREPAPRRYQSHDHGRPWMINH